MSRIDSKLLVVLLLSFVATGCGVDPFSQLISNKMKDSYGQTAPICPQALATSSMSVQSASRTKKVQVGKQDDGTLSTMGISARRRIKAGTKLVATYTENCLSGGTKVVYQDFSVDNDRDTDDLEEEAQSNPCLTKITENFTYRINMTSNDTDLSSQEHLDAIRAQSAYDTFYHATNGLTKTIIIAVVDSGVDIDHPDLVANVWRNTRETAGNGRDDDGNGFIDDIEGWNFAARGSQASNNPRPLRWDDSPGDEAHGTHVAGLAAAVWNNSRGGTGVMGKNIKIMAINVFGDSSEGSTARLNQGIRYAADNGADIINLSLGACGFDQTTFDTILYAICKGSTVVTAAGNTYYLSGSQMEGRELSNDQADAQHSCLPAVRPATPLKYFQTPASFGSSVNGLITVGSSDAIPDPQDRYSKSDFSGWSASLVEIAAPGSQAGTAGLYSTLPGNTYGREEGTSMSTPVVAGALALAKSYADKKGVQLTPMRLERLLIFGSRHEPLLDGRVRNGRHLDLVNLANEIESNISSYR